MLLSPRTVQYRPSFPPLAYRHFKSPPYVHWGALYLLNFHPLIFRIFSLFLIQPPVLLINSFIHSDYFCCASSSPLLVRGAGWMDGCVDGWMNGQYVSEFHSEAPQATASEGLVQGPYVAARAGFEPATLRTMAPDLPMTHHATY